MDKKTSANSITNDTEDVRKSWATNQRSEAKLGKLNLPKEPDHLHPDLRRHTDPQMGFTKGRRKGIQHFLIIR